MGLPLPLKGRGTAVNPANRFEPLHYQPDPDAGPEEAGPRTRVFKDTSRTILVRNDSPDVPFAWSLNPYRGCEHGCSYWYAQPKRAYSENRTVLLISACNRRRSSSKNRLFFGALGFQNSGGAA